MKTTFYRRARWREKVETRKSDSVECALKHFIKCGASIKRFILETYTQSAAGIRRYRKKYWFSTPFRLLHLIQFYTEPNTFAWNVTQTLPTSAQIKFIWANSIEFVFESILVSFTWPCLKKLLLLVIPSASKTNPFSRIDHRSGRKSFYVPS